VTRKAGLEYPRPGHLEPTMGAGVLLGGPPYGCVPEAIGIRARGDAFPPLTHVIRHFLPNYIAFPLIHGLFGAIAARWMEFPRPWPLGGTLGASRLADRSLAGHVLRPGPRRSSDAACGGSNRPFARNGVRVSMLQAELLAENADRLPEQPMAVCFATFG
jgi:hypothetical protein